MSTASLVYTGKKPVAEATAEKVRRAASELGYGGPDPRASSLRQGRSGVVGAVVPSRLLYAFRDPYAVLMFDGLTQELGETGSGLLLLPDASQATDATPGSGLAVDAVVFMLCTELGHPLVDELRARRIPMVATGAPKGSDIVQVLVDDRGASATAARHLRDLGHRRIGHVLMPLNVGNSTGIVDFSNVEGATYLNTRDRAYGVRDVLGEDVPMAEAAEPDVEEGRAAAGLLLDAPTPPTAIIAQSDLLAAGVIQAAEERGLRVPEDLSVTGFDGVELPWLGRTLTTIDQHPTEKGRLVGSLVRRLLEGETVADVHAPADLRIGDTTAPPR